MADYAAPPWVDSLRRQRRFLIGVSFALTLVLGAGLEFDKISLVGNEAKITRPELVPVLLWIVWAYALLRYWQHIVDIEDLGFHAAFSRKLNPLLRKTAIRNLKDTFKSPSDRNLVWIPPLHYDFDRLTIDEKAPSLITVLIDAGITIRTPNGMNREHLQGYPIEISGWRLARLKVGAWVAVAFNTRLMTEHGLPFVIAAVPVIVRFALRDTG